MEKQSRVQFLKEIELFNGLDEKELGLLAEKFELIKIKAEELLFKEQDPRDKLDLIVEGEIELFKTTPFNEEQRLAYFTKFDFLGEGSLIDNSPHSTSARTKTECTILSLSNTHLIDLTANHSQMLLKIVSKISKFITGRVSHSNSRMINISEQYVSGHTRMEHDLLGDREVSNEHYYGVQTMRARENFNITGVQLNFFPALVNAFAMVKMATARANHDLGILDKEVTNAIEEACRRIIQGRYHRYFVVDMVQGGAGTSTNMNANEVIANVALEIMGYKKGEYKYCHPNNHVNLSQSTNDAYPTAVKIAMINSNEMLIEVLKRLIDSFHKKGQEFAHVLKMGRTQLQDAVPMTMGQEFDAYAETLSEEIQRLNQNAALLTEVNMGATAIGTGINSLPGYRESVTKHLRDITNLDIKTAFNLVEATQDTGAFIMYSSSLKRLSVKLSKIANDLRLLSSGPRTGLSEINLPPMQPGSSIMPGKVNPVIPEVVNQIAYKVIGNDLTVTLAAEAGQLELNVMEPIIVHSIMESIEMLKNGMHVFKHRCIDGITANEEHCRNMVLNSIGLVTALVPIIGYDASTEVAKEATESKRGVYEVVLEKGYLSKEQLDEILKPENMISPKNWNNHFKS